ncbi:MAG: hypothetical protein RL456_171 [Pseudomonadota bacterium]
MDAAGLRRGLGRLTPWLRPRGAARARARAAGGGAVPRTADTGEVAAATLDSPLWYRVADVVPRLRPTVRVRHRGTGAAMRHVLADTLTGRHHLLDEAGWAFVGRFDGRRTIGELWTWLTQHEPHPPTQHEVLEWLATLDAAGLLQCEKLPDLQALLRGQLRSERRHRQGSLNPLSWRIPLGDPTRWLARLDPLAHLLAHPLALVLMALVVLAGLAQALLEAPALRADVAGRLASPAFLGLTWIVYPCIKALHELGHALAVRHHGAEVRHVGIGVLYLVPAPYVDASAASGLAVRRQRVMISAAGVAVELVLAALGVLVWAAVQPGAVRDAALAVALVGGVSTLLANANPLVRMDGYHVLADLIDVPNLAQRSRRWWIDALRAFASRRPRPALPAGGTVQRAVTLAHAPAAMAFGLAVVVSVCLWLATMSPGLAVAVAAIAGWMQVARPVLGALRWMTRAPDLSGRRAMTLLRSAAVVAALAAGVLLVPMPRAVTAEALAWMPEEALVRAPSDGFVGRVAAQDASTVQAGAPLLVLVNEEMGVELAKVRAQRLDLEVKAHGMQLRDPAGAQRAEVEARALMAQEDDLARRIAQLDLRSRREGRVSWLDVATLEGRHVRRGDVLGHVLADDRVVARVAVPDADTANLLHGVRGVEVMALEAPGRAHAGRWDGVVPATVGELPAAALGAQGGGRIETDPADDRGLRTLAPVAVIDVRVPDMPARRLGARLLVRFDLGWQPLGTRWLQRLQQTVLRHLSGATDVPGGH